MLWNYDDSWRDKFETCEHRDILIVPHGTNVRKNPGGAPIVTSKIPKLDPETDIPIPGEFVPVEFVITNEDIYKEKFEYTNSLDTNEDLAFCGCESAMVKFTIRNNKTYNEETGKWELDIPNLQNYIITDENGNTITGEVDTHYIIKLYMYFNGDSSSLIYMGMFIVEEDKVSSDGYTREITAFDFLYQIRDMDIHNWYKHLFTGVSYTDNDFLKYFENRKLKVPEDYTPETYYNEGWIRKPPENGYWILKDMLEDLFKNLLTRYPDTRTVTNRENKPAEDRTGDDPNGPKHEELRYTNDAEPYTGLAMPIVLDPDLFDPTKKYDIPTEPGTNARECYGYMDIMNLKVYEDPKIMDAEALSAGKFLEDIGALAGRYPYIRIDDVVDDDYHSLEAWDPEHPENWYPYNLYEKCILTFKPLPKDDTKIVADNYFDNSDIVKGFKHDQYAVGTIHIWELYTRFDKSDEPTFSYANLTNEQSEIREMNPSLLKKVQMNNNMFLDYLVAGKDAKEDDVKISDDSKRTVDKKTLLTEYKKVYNILMYGEDVVEPVTKNQKNGLLHQGYKDIKYRTYTPYELTTYADPVREPGDRIKIHFEDKVTGEVFDFDTYILSRKISGIQKMMDTYVAKGATANVTFSNYKTGTTYAPQRVGYYSSGTSSSVSSSGGTNLTGLTPNDLVEYIRNIGFRLLDEPSNVSIRFVATSSTKSNDNPIILYYYDYPLHTGESNIHNGDTTSPIYIYNDGLSDLSAYTPNVGDYVHYYGRTGDGHEYPSAVEEPYYVWDGSKWVYAGASDSLDYYYAKNEFNPDSDQDDPSYTGDIIFNNLSEICTEGSTVDTIRMSQNPNGEYGYYIKDPYRYESTGWYEYGNSSGSPTEIQIQGSINVRATYADRIHDTNNNFYIYQFPGIWTAGSYPDLGPVTINVKPHVELKWTDPDNIGEWAPVPCSWEGTIVVRKLNAPPLNRWDGTVVVDSTTKDQYKTTAFVDDTIQLNRTYYYGIFPYYTAIQDAQHPIKYYRFTKVIRVSTGKTIDAPEIISIERIN